MHSASVAKPWEYPRWPRGVQTQATASFFLALFASESRPSPTGQPHHFRGCLCRHMPPPISDLAFSVSYCKRSDLCPERRDGYILFGRGPALGVAGKPTPSTISLECNATLSAVDILNDSTMFHQRKLCVRVETIFPPPAVRDNCVH